MIIDVFSQSSRYSKVLRQAVSRMNTKLSNEGFAPDGLNAYPITIESHIFDVTNEDQARVPLGCEEFKTFDQLVLNMRGGKGPHFCATNDVYALGKAQFSPRALLELCDCTWICTMIDFTAPFGVVGESTYVAVSRDPLGNWVYDPDSSMIFMRPDAPSTTGYFNHRNEWTQAAGGERIDSQGISCSAWSSELIADGKRRLIVLRSVENLRLSANISLQPPIVERTIAGSHALQVLGYLSGQADDNNIYRDGKYPYWMQWFLQKIQIHLGLFEHLISQNYSHMNVNDAQLNAAVLEYFAGPGISHLYTYPEVRKILMDTKRYALDHVMTSARDTSQVRSDSRKAQSLERPGAAFPTFLTTVQSVVNTVKRSPILSGVSFLGLYVFARYLFKTKSQQQPLFDLITGGFKSASQSIFSFSPSKTRWEALKSLCASQSLVPESLVKPFTTYIPEVWLTSLVIAPVIEETCRMIGETFFGQKITDTAFAMAHLIPMTEHTLLRNCEFISSREAELSIWPGVVYLQYVNTSLFAYFQPRNDLFNRVAYHSFYNLLVMVCPSFTAVSFLAATLFDIAKNGPTKFLLACWCSWAPIAAVNDSLRDANYECYRWWSALDFGSLTAARTLYGLERRPSGHGLSEQALMALIALGPCIPLLCSKFTVAAQGRSHDFVEGSGLALVGEKPSLDPDFYHRTIGRAIFVNFLGIGSKFGVPARTPANDLASMTERFKEEWLKTDAFSVVKPLLNTFLETMSEEGARQAFVESNTGPTGLPTTKTFKRCYQSYLQLLHSGFTGCHTIPTMCKSDELLPIREGANGWWMKPRPILAVRTDVVVVTMGPYWDLWKQVKLRMHCGNPYVEKRGKYLVHCAVCPSSLDEMSYFLSLALDGAPDSVFIIQSGDDSLCIIVTGNSHVFVELDQSQCDQRQTKSSLTFNAKLDQTRGVPRWIAKLMHQQSKADLLLGGRSNQLRVTRTGRPSEKRQNRVTGGANTTSGNTDTCMAALIHVLLSVTVLTDLSQWQAGFSIFYMKVTGQITDNVHFCSFLKCNIVSDTSGNFHFVPSPSRCLKMGYAKDDPRGTYAALLRHLPKESRLEPACWIHLAGIRASWALTPRHPLVEAVFSLIPPETPIPERVEISWAFLEGGPVENLCWGDLNIRYGFDSSEVAECCAELRQMEFGSSIEHPVLNALMETDYL